MIAVVCITHVESFTPCKCRCCVDNIAQMISTMANLEGDETFEASFLGQADEVVQERICDDELILVKGYETIYYFLLNWHYLFLVLVDFCCAHFSGTYYKLFLNTAVTNDH